jgi:hypothetical protein
MELFPELEPPLSTTMGTVTVMGTLRGSGTWAKGLGAGPPAKAFRSRTAHPSRRFARTRLHVLAGTGYPATNDHPALVGEAIEGFLDGLPGA